MADYKIRIIVEGEDRASGPLGGIAGALGRMGEIAGGIGIARAFDAMADGAAQLGSAMVGMVVNAGGLEAQIDAIGAISGATEAEMAGLAGLINDLGINPNLKVSTYEAADAIGNLVANGLTLDEVFAGAAEQTVLLANATGADFGAAADIATDSMTLFNIGANEMGTAVDGIAGVVAASKFDIYDYQMALAAGGGAAAVAGVSFEDFNASVTAVSSSFASGSDAGTSLKTMFQRLVPQSKEAAAAMADLGLEFFNADGSMKGMAEIAGELNGAFAGLSAEQRINYMSTIFGTDAMRAAAAVAGYTTEEFAALQAQIGKTDAMQAAAMRMDNLTGDWEVFGGVLEAVGLQVGAAFQAPARAAVQGLTQLVSTATPILLDWADQAAAFVTPYVEGIVTTLTDPAWQADVSSQVTAFWENYTQNNRIAFNLGDVLEVDFSLDGAGEGITKFKLGDFFEFYSEDGVIEKIHLDQVIDFENREGITKLSIFDIFDLESAEGGPIRWNVKDWISFEGLSDQEFTLTIGGFTYTQAPEGEYTVTGWQLNGKPIGEALEEAYGAASSNLGQALTDLSANSGFDALLAKLAEPITVTLTPTWGSGQTTETVLDGLLPESLMVQVVPVMNGTVPQEIEQQLRELGADAYEIGMQLNWEGLTPEEITNLLRKLEEDPYAVTTRMMWQDESPEAYMQRVAQKKWTVNILGIWQIDVPDWMKTGSMNLLVHLKAEGLPGLGGAAAGAVAAALAGINWTLKPPTIDWGSLGQTFSSWFSGQSVDAPTVDWSGAGFVEWFRQQKITLPLPGALSDLTFTLDGGDVLAALASFKWPTLPKFAWPTLPSWSWPTLPSWSWPEMPKFSWPSLPAWRWPSLPAWSWPAIPVPSWLSWLTGGGGSGTPAEPPAATGGRRGGLTWVGEFGPELVSLPQGSWVHTAGQSRQIAAAGGQQQVFYIQPTIYTPLDVEEMTRVIADRLRRRGG